MTSLGFLVCYATLNSGALMCSMTPLPMAQAVEKQINWNDWNRFDPRSSDRTPWFLVPATTDPMRGLR